jgi:capsular exopolysaccharide synthesis family protein
MPKPSGVSPTNAPVAELDYVQILRGVLRRRKTVVIATFALIALPLLGWILYGQRPRFESKATVHIKPSIAEMVPGARNLPVGPNLSVQMAVLQSRTLATEVLDAVPEETVNELMQESLEPDHFVAFSNAFSRLLGKAPDTTSPRQRALSELRQARMKFQPLREAERNTPTGLVQVSATAFKPRVAMDLVNAYVQVLVNWSRRSEQEDVTATQKFLELQLNRVQTDLEHSQAQLGEFEDRHGVVRLNDRTQFEVSQLVQLQGNLAQIQANQEVARGRLKALEKALKGASKESSVTSTAQVSANTAQTISARLAQLEAALVQMQAKYTEEHPSLIATREEIQSLRSQLARIPVANISDPLASIESMSRDDIIQSIAAVKGELGRIRAQEQPLQLQIAHLRASLQKLSGRESEYSKFHKEVVSNRALLSFLSDKLFALRIREQSHGGVVKIIDPPNLPTSPVGAVSLRKLMFLLVFALGTAGGLGFLVEYIYEPVESEKTIRQQVGLPLLGSALAVPSRRPKGDERPKLVFNEGRKAAMPQEFYRNIRTNLEAANLQMPFKAIMITSPWPGEGKSTTAINLAVTLRELGRRVALVEADLRNPGLNRVLRAERPGGLTQLLEQTQNVGDVVLPLDVSLEVMGPQSESDFLFIPSGDSHADPAALLGSARARELVTRLKRAWDYVLIDSPPILLVSDNLLFAKALDGAILVARSGQTKKRDLNRAKSLLEEAGVRIIGVILNEVPLKHMPYYYHKYRSYYAPYRPHVPRRPGKRG